MERRPHPKQRRLANSRNKLTTISVGSCCHPPQVISVATPHAALQRAYIRLLLFMCSVLLFGELIVTYFTTVVLSRRDCKICSNFDTKI